VAEGQASIAAAVQARGLDVDVDGIALHRPTLDEVFLSLTGAPAGYERKAQRRARQGGGIANRGPPSQPDSRVTWRAGAAG
jgi:hypothetical protein